MKNLYQIKEMIEALNGVYAEVNGQELNVKTEKYPSSIVKYAAKNGVSLQVVSEKEVPAIHEGEYQTFEAVMVLK